MIDVALLLKNPKEFFKKAKKELNPLFVLFTFPLISVVGTAFTVQFHMMRAPPNFAFFLVAFYVTLVSNILILTGISHVASVWLGGKGKIADTFRAVLYGNLLVLIFSWIGYLAILAFFWAIYLTSVGLATYHKFNLNKGFIAYILSIVFTLFLAMHVGMVFLPQ